MIVPNMESFVCLVFSRGLATLELAMSVCRLVCQSVHRSVCNKNKIGAFSRYSAPAHPSVTGGSVYDLVSHLKSFKVMTSHFSSSEIFSFFVILSHSTLSLKR